MFPDKSNNALAVKKKHGNILLLHATELFQFWPWVKNVCQVYQNFVFDTTHK